ncbi:glycoside hydrolase family 13 protein [Dactylosporangium darangshiense]|uniref:Glycoside hydrolase family 13 protein n=1 Tax=Dactylosporangium darangshiense TaxID=579108 RepID=A0ABP8DUP1_9ACTN
MADQNHQAWWRSAAIYQVYLRSFADGNGDGVGDLAGLRSRLPYLAGLGIDAIWIVPWYPSPLADGGYDVADFRAIDPIFGTLAEAEKLIEEAHAAGIRVICDIVPNHCSDQHAWFQRALASAPGSPERDLFWFRKGRGADGELPPTDLQSIFGGPAWTRVADGEWYLHLFAPEQPDFNWEHPAVREEFEDILRFWLDRGIDGIRIDSAAVLIKDPLVSDVYEDNDGIHEVYQSWRRIADTYSPPRALIGEVWLPDHEAFARYLRADELHTAFNFAFLGAPWEAGKLRYEIDMTLEVHAPVAAPATWVLSNHDVTREVTRFGREVTNFAFAEKRFNVPSDLELGTRRARAAALLTMSLPGAYYLYQGEELGLEEVEDLDDALREDPMFHRSGGVDPGRDGCRVPLPWSGSQPPFGFSPADASGEPWLPQPAHWAGLSVAAQQGEPGSFLQLYCDALRIRREDPALGDGPMRWLESDPQVLAFARDESFANVTNLGTEPTVLPPHREVLLSSVPLNEDGTLPPDASAWIRLA